MKNFTFILYILLITILLPATSNAQFRNYSLVYTSDAKGSIVMFGNTLMNITDTHGVSTVKMNDNSSTGNSIYGNDRENMQYTDADGNDGNGRFTRNSSTADLSLPAGTNTIKLARLYWGGRVKTADFDLTLQANQRIGLRKGVSSLYTGFIAEQIDKNIFIQDSEEYVRYQAFADITSFIQVNGAGTYSVANAPLSVGAIDNGGNYGGWCIVVVYENTSLSFNSLRLYDGFQQVFDSGNLLTTSIRLSGLNVPPGILATTDATVGVTAWEGDANLTGDFLKINGNLFSNEINPPNNPWNGTISNNGIHVTTKNPDYTNQMGIDIDQFYAGTGYGIMPNDTSAILEFGTEADQYFPGIMSFVIKSAASPLPVSLLYFNGLLSSTNYARIVWGTSMDVTGTYFTLERSFDGNSFIPVATVQNNGSSSLQHDYSIINDLSDVVSPIIYYRLRQTDADGGKYYSKVIALRVKDESGRLFISPNPVKNHIDLNVDWNKSETAVLNILDISGKKCLVKNISLIKGNNNLKVDDMQGLPPGTYIVQVISAGKKITEKIDKL